jgi:hypothetical protein
VFGSEVKALLEHPSMSRDLNELAFIDYLTYSFTPAVDDVPRDIEARARRTHARAVRRLG